jgi:hypothetical protein
MISCVMPAAARGRAAPPRNAAAHVRPGAAAPASPGERGRRFDNPTALADAAAEVAAAEGETARSEAAVVRAVTAASLTQSAPPEKAPKTSNDAGDSAAANDQILEPSEWVVHNANAKALEAAARTAADDVMEKERIQVELDKMKALFEGSGTRVRWTQTTK